MKAAPIPVEEYENRHESVQAEMARRDLDLVLVTLPDNIHYLTGYQTEGLVADLFLAVQANDKPLIVTRNIDMGNLLAEVDNTLVADIALYADDANSPDAIMVL